MRKYLKKQINNMLNTLLRANDILRKLMLENKSVQVKVLSEDLIASAEELIGYISEETEGENKCIECLTVYVEALRGCLHTSRTADKASMCAVLKKHLNRALEILQEEIVEDKLKITFMPYKADMWTCMASIWEAAIKDEACEVTVVPIPYYDIANSEDITFHYEAERFPQEVGCIHYDNYSEEEQYPDIIVIHNPYDDTNNLTRVPERFYASNLVNCTARLVYAPYYTMSVYVEEKHKIRFLTPGNQLADSIICQSQRVKEIYEQIGYPSEKLLAFGSPKIDAVINAKVTREDVPCEWREKIGNKKVFLLNTHLSYFPMSFMNTEKSGNYAVRFCNEILDAFLNRDDCVLIWRPHPLLKEMVRGRFTECLEYVNAFERKIREADNGIIDENGNYLYSFTCADALISTWSSLINEFMVTKKPILIFQTRVAEKYIPQSPINTNTNYFRFGKGCYTFEQFRDNVIDGIDPKYEERVQEIERAFPNLDGQAGSKIYNFLKEN